MLLIFNVESSNYVFKSPVLLFISHKLIFYVYLPNLRDSVFVVAVANP